MADKFAVITGGSSGIGLELAKLAVADGYDVLIAADRDIDRVPAEIGGNVETLQVDLSTTDGVDQLLAKIGSRQVDVLCANAGHGLGRGFLDQSVADWRHVIDTNVVGTLYLLHNALKPMVARNSGKVLVTGSIAGFIPGSFQAVYNGSKAFVDSFIDAIRNELKDSEGLTITTLMPGPVETEFFHRADMDDTSVGQGKKDDPAKVAKDGWEAMLAGKADIVSGLKNKLQVAASRVLPEAVTAGMHRNMAEPGSGDS